MGTTRQASTVAMATEVWGRLGAYFERHRERVRELLRDMGLSFGDMRALMVLDTEHPQPMRALADVWACDASNATWVVDRLEQRGLVERRPLAGDRRVKAVCLTDDGAKTKAQLLERLAQPPDDLLGLDRADLEALRDALARLPGSAPGQRPR